jgi:hypothetical protein
MVGVAGFSWGEAMMADAPEGSRVAGYVIEGQFGAGGMAVVYLAVDERLNRKVALKVLSAELAGDDAFRLRFIRESRIAASVDDPHIIPVSSKPSHSAPTGASWQRATSAAIRTCGASATASPSRRCPAPARSGPSRSAGTAACWPSATTPVRPTSGRASFSFPA